LTLVISNKTISTHYDWEALAVGSCGHIPSEGKVAELSSCIYIADVGDNVARNTNGKRTDRKATDPYRIIKIREPWLDQYNASSLGQNSDARLIPDADVYTLIFDYGHASSPTDYSDCEAMLLDSVGWGFGGAPGDLYLVTKWNSDSIAFTRLIKIPVSAWALPSEGNANAVFRNGFSRQELPERYSPRAVGSYFHDNDLIGETWTGADMTRDGTVIALSSYFGTSLFLRCPGSTVAEALTGQSRSCHSFPHPSPGQVETSAWTADGKHHFEIPEGPRAIIGKTKLLYDEDAIGATCPSLEWVVVDRQPTYCRAVDDQSIKPDDWCHHSSKAVPLVFLKDDEHSAGCSAKHPLRLTIIASVAVTLAASISLSLLLG